MKTYQFKALRPGPSHFSATEIKGNKVSTVQFSVETLRGKNVEVEVDYQGKTVRSLNKFVRVVHSEFSERTVMDLQ